VIAALLLRRVRCILGGWRWFDTSRRGTRSRLPQVLLNRIRSLHSHPIVPFLLLAETTPADILVDLAVLWQAGFCNTACAIGTHLTPAQLAQLRENPDLCVYIAFDQDQNQAGQNAANALLHCLDQAGLHVRLVDLPAGQDPNSYFTRGATLRILPTS
jgi:hypothetical protein